ncbi:MAG: hypothetical protein R2712_16875 [Vicinamibacterales bacterium]
MARQLMGWAVRLEQATADGAVSATSGADRAPTPVEVNTVAPPAAPSAEPVADAPAEPVEIPALRLVGAGEITSRTPDGHRLQAPVASCSPSRRRKA